MPNQPGDPMPAPSAAERASQAQEREKSIQHLQEPETATWGAPAVEGGDPFTNRGGALTEREKAAAIEADRKAGLPATEEEEWDQYTRSIGLAEDEPAEEEGEAPAEPEADDSAGGEAEVGEDQAEGPMGLELARAMVALAEAGLDESDLDGLPPARLVAMAAKLGRKGGTETQGRKTYEPSEKVKSIRGRLVEELGDEAAEIADVIEGLDVTNQSLQGTLRTLLERSAIARVRQDYGTQLTDTKDLIKRGHVQWNAGVDQGLYTDDADGMEQAFLDAARSQWGPPKSTKPRPAKVAPPAARRADREQSGTMDAEEFDRRAAIAADRGDKKEQQRLKRLQEAGKVTGRRNLRLNPTSPWSQ